MRASVVDNGGGDDNTGVVGNDASQDCLGGHVSTSFVRLAGSPRRVHADVPLTTEPPSSNGTAITHFLLRSYKLFLSTVNNGPEEKLMGEISVFATVAKSWDKGSLCMCHDYVQSLLLVSAGSFTKPK